MDQAVLVLYPSCVAALLSLGPLPYRPLATDVIVILAVLVALFAVASMMLLFSHPHGPWWGVVAYSDADMRGGRRLLAGEVQSRQRNLALKHWTDRKSPKTGIWD